jgi:dTDP-4-dehydrorhamnose 3,5-epimerase-like enzyme
MSHEIAGPTFERVDERGELAELTNIGRWSALLRGKMRAGAVMGHHYHRRTQVFFFLTRGSAAIRTIDVATGEMDRFGLDAGRGVLLSPGESHAIVFGEDSEFVMLKSEAHDPAAPDTFRFAVPE